MSKDHFEGQFWRPRGLLDTVQVAILQDVIAKVIFRLDQIDLDKLPTAATMKMKRRDVVWAYDRMKRNRLRDQASFVIEAGRIMDIARQVLEEEQKWRRLT